MGKIPLKKQPSTPPTDSNPGYDRELLDDFISNEQSRSPERKPNLLAAALDG
jgi:hypothetical protein